MAEFCTCGSIIIGGNCTNKNCSNRSVVKTGTTKAAGSKTSKTTSSVKKEPKTTKTRKASKVITYNLYDTERLEENID